MIGDEQEWTDARAMFQGGLRLGLDPKDEPKRVTFEAMIYWLAKVFQAVDWKKIARSKTVRREDVFEHVIKAASTQANVRRVNDRICEDLGLQSIQVPPRILDGLEQGKAIVLRSLRLEPVYFALKAMDLADGLWKRLSKMKGEKQDG
nr:hypothetical protein [Candidatus Sigynarchaeum springense]